MLKKCLKTICQNKGETLIESLISILILSILFSTIALTIASSLRITDYAAQRAAAAQEAANAIIAGHFDVEVDDTVTFTFNYDILEFDSFEGDYVVSSTEEITIEYDVLTFTDSEFGFRTFRPEP